MRTALLLLTTLGLAAVPGSLLPQRGVASDPGAVAQFARDNPTLAPWLDRLGLFEVYSSAWFAAVYLLLLTSLTGCVLPRCRRLWRAVRADPPAAPTDLRRLEQAWQGRSVEEPRAVLAAAAAELRRRRWRVRQEPGALSAETGYGREAGNLGFHLSLLVLLYGVALGSLVGFEGRAIVVEGGGWANTRSQYDEFWPGPWTDEGALQPFSFTLQDFDARYEEVGPQRSTPRDFSADLLVQVGTEGAAGEASEAAEAAEAGPEPFELRVNRPLEVGGTKVFLTGNGYAPRVTVRDGTGAVVLSGPVVFLPVDGNLTSEGVVKVPDAAPTALAFEGLFLPTAVIDERGPVSDFPDARDPRLVLTAWTGDLGLDRPQSVYALDKAGLSQVTEGGEPFARSLAVGETMALPDGRGSLTFDGVARFANVQIAHDPGKEVALAAAVLLLVGLTASLLVRQRRLALRVVPADGGASVTIGVRGLTRRGTPPGEVERLAQALGLRPDGADAVAEGPHAERDSRQGPGAE